MTAVVGLDLSLTATGVASAGGVVVVRSEGHANATLTERAVRLADVRARIVSAVDAGARKPGDLVVIEGPSFRSGDPGTWDRAGLWWGVVDRLLALGLDIAVIAPTTLKKYATGVGTAKKGAMVDAAARRIPDVITGGEDNAVDALWLRAAGLEHLGRPIAKVPAEQRAALDPVTWPKAVA